MLGKNLERDSLPIHTTLATMSCVSKLPRLRLPYPICVHICALERGALKLHPPIESNMTHDIDGIT